MAAEWVWVLIPLAGIAIGGLAIYLDHQKKMALIEKGMKEKDVEKKWDKRDHFRGGLVMMGIGAAFLISAFTFWADEMTAFGFVGLICGFIGIALVLSYLTEKK